MAGQSRAGDMTVGVCPLHKSPRGVTGRIIASQGNVFTDNKANALLGDKVIHQCGHIGRIVTCSQISTSGGKGDARVGDKVSGGPNSTIVQGSGGTDSK